MACRVVCKTGPATKPKQALIILTIGEAVVSWESEFKYKVCAYMAVMQIYN